MKLLLFGNVGTGKSSLRRELQNVFNDYTPIVIDDYRRAFGDGSMQKEKLAKIKFIEAIDTNNTNQIIEASGLGDTGEMIFEKLSSTADTKIVVVLYSELDVCLERLKNRKWDIPYPNKVSSVAGLVERQQLLYQQGDLKQKWRNQTNTVYLGLKNNSESDLIQNYFTIQSTINETKRNN